MDEQSVNSYTKIDPSDLEGLRRIYGQNVSRYLEGLSKIQKTASGAFVISPRKHFEKCQEFIRKEVEVAREKKSKRTSKIADLAQMTITTPFDSDEDDEDDCSELDRDTIDPSEVKSNNEQTKKTLTTRMEKYTGKSKRISLAKAILKFPQFVEVRSERRHNSKQLFKWMMEVEISDVQENFDYTACIEDVESVLTEFQKRHEKYRYHMILRTILRGERLEVPKDDYALTLKQYQLFVYKVTANVIPKALFGCNRNIKIVRKALKEFYQSFFETALNLEKSIHSLDISRIPWLQKINDKKTQRLIIAKVTKWLFDNFFMKLFQAVFFELKSPNNDKRVIVVAEKWRNFKRSYINHEVRQGNVAKIVEDSEDDGRMSDVPCGQMMLQPKLPGVRPIYVIRPTGPQKRELALLRTILQQLYQQKYETMHFEKLHTTWLSYAKANDETTNRKVNIVTCDVADAFGTIIQTKLFDIVSSLLDEVPDENLLLPCYEVISPKTMKNYGTEFKRWFNCWPASFNAPKHSLIAISKQSMNKVFYVEKEYVRAKFAAFIFEQFFRDELYLLRKGIFQGSSLSSVFSDIYYQEMMIQEFGVFMQSGNMLRYVDDYIYMTREEESAERFLKAIGETVPGFDCQFKETKIQTNVKSQKYNPTESVVYIGFDMNGETMEVSPKYDELTYPYVPSVKDIARKNSLPIFDKELKKMECFKLHPIVLDPTLNSLSKLCETARNAATLLAMRCMFLIETIFVDPSEHSEDIWKIMKNLVRKLGAIFCRDLTANDCAKWSTFPKIIMASIWQSFILAFKRNSELRAIFHPLITASRKKTSCH